MICAVVSWILLSSLDYPSLRSSLCVGLLAHRHYDSVSLSEAELNLLLWKMQGMMIHGIVLLKK
jgi:hypothetical protein